MPVLGQHPDQRAADRRVVFHKQKLCHGNEGSPFARDAAVYRGFSYNRLNPLLGQRVGRSSVHRRILFGVVAWLLGAATATAGSLLAISLLGQGITGNSGQLLTQDAVSRALASQAAEAPPSAAASATSGPAASAPARTAPAASATPAATDVPAPGQGADTGTASPSGDGTVLTSAGGEIVASCQAAGAYLVSWSPLQGYEVDSVNRGPAATARVTFESTTQRVTMVVSCSAGVPSAASYSGEADE
jgi:hypothetical protein